MPARSSSSPSSNTTAYNDGPSDENVRIQPNLEEGYITLTIESPSAIVTFTNKDGKVVKTVDGYVSGKKIKINKMPKGMYIVGVKTIRGEKKIKFNLK